MSVINSTPLLMGEDGYQISRSVRLRSSASAYFNRTPASAGNRKTWTWSGWVKFGNLADCALFQSYSDANNRTQIGIGGNQINFTNLLAGSINARVNTSAVYRDPSAWYHIVAVYDSTDATASNRMKLYVNGVLQTSLLVATYPAQNTDLFVNNNIAHYVGRDVGWPTLDGYLTEINFIDGQALTPSSFGETDAVTGVWKPKKYAGTYGTNGFYLNFSDNSAATAAAIGKDSSGNGNNWTPNNISVTAGVTYDSMIDTPTPYADGGNGRGNYAVINPTMTPQFAQTYSEGNLKCTGGYAYVNAQSTIGASSGKWYAEAVFTAKTSATLSVGINNKAVSNYIGNSGETGSVGYWTNATKTINGSSTAYGATYTTNDVIGVAMDIDGGTVTFYKNGTSQGSISYTFSGEYGFLTGGGGAFASGDTVVWNFGQRPFAYTAPSGFKALCTTNLPEPTIANGDKHFNAVLYTGNGTNSNTVTTNFGFTPDLIWNKNRSNAASHALQSSPMSWRYLSSDSTAADGSAQIGSVGSNSYLIASGNSIWNASGNTYVSWCWKANGSGVTNNDGSITSTVSANTTSGFSIVTYTGNGSTGTVGHGLGVVPKLIIVKDRDDAGTNWCVYTETTGNANRLLLNLTNASAATANWNSTSPTSVLFSVGASSEVNASTKKHVAYCFAEVAGYSKFGSYTGNGSTDGPFVALGFKPKFWMSKRTDSTSSWLLVDGARNTYNIVDDYIMPNSSAAENSANVMDFLSNGVKFRGTTHNDAGATWIYMAFAENPFKNSLAR